jgi:ABC-type uncharacterized transport system permease subunit
MCNSTGPQKIKSIRSFKFREVLSWLIDSVLCIYFWIINSYTYIGFLFKSFGNNKSSSYIFYLFIKTHNIDYTK